MKLRTTRVRSPSRRAREANGQDASVVRGGPGIRARGRTPRSRSSARRAPIRGTQIHRGRPIVASRATERELVQADLDAASDGDSFQG